ncbi:MAG: 1-acyl-sn-glycerol-3-phosphate acyltransferase [Muribaculaceae bacterium]|nr:1-acyl-sn-glycerol-3-phosphate acyltransferase [Muribaculaceae bacterium]
MIQKKLNKDGEDIYVFDQYPDIEVRKDVITMADVRRVYPPAAKHPRIVKWLMKLFEIDEVNRVHGCWSMTPGPDFVKHLVEDEFKVDLRVDNPEILERFKTGAFITVSNHPFGQLDGIVLIYLITRIRPEFKVMVNMILNQLSAMRPNFIAVDQGASADPEKRRVSVAGVREAIRLLKEGMPVGFFPAGAIGKTDREGIIVDRPWQPTVLQIIGKAKVPVIPIYFHGTNSRMFNFFGHHCVPLRTMCLARELFRKRGKPMRVTIGEPVSVEKQLEFGKDYEALGQYLRRQTYLLSGREITSVAT